MYMVATCFLLMSVSLIIRRGRNKNTGSQTTQPTHHLKEKSFSTISKMGADDILMCTMAKINILIDQYTNMLKSKEPFTSESEDRVETSEPEAAGPSKIVLEGEEILAQAKLCKLENGKLAYQPFITLVDMLTQENDATDRDKQIADRVLYEELLDQFTKIYNLYKRTQPYDLGKNVCSMVTRGTNAACDEVPTEGNELPKICTIMDTFLIGCKTNVRIREIKHHQSKIQSVLDNIIVKVETNTDTATKTAT